MQLLFAIVLQTALVKIELILNAADQDLSQN
jgi:hypothetical protein